MRSTRYPLHPTLRATFILAVLGMVMWLLLWLLRPPATVGGGVFFSGLDPELQSGIQRSMRSIAQRHNTRGRAGQVDELIRNWSHRPYDIETRVARLGVASVPYIECKSRSEDERVRYIALQIMSAQLDPRLSFLLPPVSERKQLHAAIKPIMIRALSDVSPKIRRHAVGQVSYLCPADEAKAYLQSLTDDPDANVRAEATRAMQRLSRQ